MEEYNILYSSDHLAFFNDSIDKSNKHTYGFSRSLLFGILRNTSINFYRFPLNPS